MFVESISGPRAVRNNIWLKRAFHPFTITQLFILIFQDLQTWQTARTSREHFIGGTAALSVIGHVTCSRVLHRRKKKKWVGYIRKKHNVCVFVCVMSFPIKKTIKEGFSRPIFSHDCVFTTFYFFQDKKNLQKYFPFKSHYVCSFGNVDGGLQPNLNGGVRNRF